MQIVNFIWLHDISENSMLDNTPLKRDALPENFDTIEAFQTFWDTHSSADYEDLMQTVDATVNLESDTLHFTVAKDLWFTP